MKEFGLNLLGRAIYDATFSEICKPFSHASTVTLAAQGAEILIKARIAEEHPLLIFSKIPNISQKDDLLGIQNLFDSGKSYTYEDLPNLLWATVGVRIKSLDEYKQFGTLRNKIMHFAVPNVDLPKLTLEFIINVMEPLIEEFWQETSLEYAEQFDDVIVSEGYLKEQLIQYGISLTPRILTFLDAQ
ncbi:hypothetical protein [Undibacterium oligocarboniphilum]|uniref:Uncharacterized protein n=1 Tax=Undibacterium oligocarboniphilum TaxID=666702 RepID=A0A850QIH6_9BURK|nr:hypothetical protein [Undibacterium oligocarboniphilum]MBC3871143.1 hypothetical protein [Undibacterium oligocarboniphilum]NVO76234.1 hypothetical protein [Undibacterium oligocarboniphilum]